MKPLLSKTLKSLKRNGLMNTCYLVATYPFRAYLGRRKTEIVFGKKDLEHRFTKIYELKYWGRTKSVSGRGSILEYTENIRKRLPELLEKYSIRSVFDAPCGDFNWMRHVLKECPVEYVGGDIVSPLIESNNRKYKTDRIGFMQIDLTKDKFPPADLMLCRDCLFHLSYADTKSILENFIASDIAYLLTTTCVNLDGFQNQDISSGEHRLMDLFSAPYNFPKNVLSRIDDWQEPDPKKELCLWTREQVIAAVGSF